MGVITISRQSGAGGWTLGERLAERLGYHYVDEVILKQVADKMGVTAEDIIFYERDGATKLMKFLDKVVSRDFINRMISDKYGYLEEERYVKVLTTIVKGLYERDNVVIVARAGQYILKGQEGVKRILLVDDVKKCIRFAMEKHKMTEPEAEKYIKKKERIRTNFLSFFAEKACHDDPKFYDLVLNMESISLAKAEDVILTLMDHEICRHEKRTNTVTVALPSQRERPMPLSRPILSIPGSR